MGALGSPRAARPVAAGILKVVGCHDCVKSVNGPPQKKKARRRTVLRVRLGAVLTSSGKFSWMLILRSDPSLARTYNDWRMNISTSSSASMPVAN